MPLLELKQKDLQEISRTYGTVHETLIGKVSYTKLTDPDGFVLVAKDDQLRYYLFQKPGGVWEHVWGASSIVHDGLPTAETLIQWRLKHALRAGKQGLDEASALSGQLLDLAASDGTSVHKAAEDLLNGKSVNLAGRNRKQMWGIASLANFFQDYEVRNWRTEQVTAFDKTMPDGVRIVYAGTVDLIIEIYDKLVGQWFTWLIDYKTSKEVYTSHKLQALAYKASAEQSLGIKIDRVGILLLGKETQKGYLLSEVGKERGYKLTFADFELTYRMLLMMNNGKLPGPKYTTFPKSIKISKEIIDENLSTTTVSAPADSSIHNLQAGTPSGGATTPF